MVFTFLLGVAYPLVVTAVGQVAFHDKANGSLIEVDGVVVGSELLGQNFVAPQYFHSRPVGGRRRLRRLGQLRLELRARRTPTSSPPSTSASPPTVRRTDCPTTRSCPVDAVTASASGLDPAISIANARLQAPRVAAERGLELAEVLSLIDDHTNGRDLVVLGEPAVQVLPLNLALDALTGRM